MKSWTVPLVMKGGGVQVGRPERPGMHQPSDLRKNIKIRTSIYCHPPSVGELVHVCGCLIPFLLA